MISRTRRLVGSVSVVIFAAGVNMLLLVDRESMGMEPPKEVVSPIATRSGNRTLAPIATFAAIAERPLFAPNRRPLSQAPAAVPTSQISPPPPPPKLSATLVGVLISPTERFVVLRWPDGKNATVAEGGAVEGWLLKQIMPDRASFVSGTTNAEITFPVHPLTTAESSATSPVVPTRRRQ
jgi:hypothetical protein